MDIIEEYTKYIDAKPDPSIGNRGFLEEVKSYIETRLAGKYRKLDQDTQALRVQSLQYATNDPRRLEVLEALKAAEGKMVALKPVIEKYNAVLDRVGCISERGIREARSETATVPVSALNQALTKYRICRELPASQGGHPDLLPSDLCNVPEYKAFEDEMRAKIEAGKALYAEQTEAMEELDALSSEAWRLF